MMCFLMNWKKGLFELRVLMRTSGRRGRKSYAEDAKEEKMKTKNIIPFETTAQ
jgi:hypothetical protein